LNLWKFQNRKKRVTTQPKIDRSAWLALWAQRRRRVLQQRRYPGPVLRAAYPDLLQWDWDLWNPYKWNVWMSSNGGVSYVLIEDYWTFGDARQFAPDGGSELYYIVGVDESGKEITWHSNAVRPDDAPVPTGLLDGLLAYYDFADSTNYVSHAVLDPLTVRDDGLTNPVWSADTGPGGKPALYFAGELDGSRDFQGNVLTLDVTPWQYELSQLPLTVSFWLKGDAVSNGEFIYGTMPVTLMDSLSEQDVCRLYTYNGDSYLESRSDTGEWNSVDTGFSVLDDEWHMHTLVIDSTGVTRYFDGDPLESSEWFTPAEGLWSADSLSVGGLVWLGDLSTVFDGNLTQFGFWQRALSVPDVAQLYNDGNGLAYEMF